MASGMAFLAPVAHRVIPHWVAESQNIHPRVLKSVLGILRLQLRPKAEVVNEMVVLVSICLVVG
eukprot:1361140-Amorphochlora_amoeboformis.AAC.1